MCGIMGYYAFSDALPNKTALGAMFSMLESRGTDASGFAYVSDGELNVYKAPVKASGLIKSSVWKELSLPKVMIFHTRLKTKGCQLNNKNNHPLFTREGLCIVHNGQIYNDDQILSSHRIAEVDSEAILSVLESYPEDLRLDKLFEKLIGPFAIASIDALNPDKLILVKHNNPVELYFDAENDILYFCSERWIMQKALNISSSVRRGFNLGEFGYHFFTMENDYAMVIGKYGIQSYREYKTPTPVYNYVGIFEVQCPVCLNYTKFNMLREENRCMHCNNVINEEEVDNVFPEN